MGGWVVGLVSGWLGWSVGRSVGKWIPNFIDEQQRDSGRLHGC